MLCVVASGFASSRSAADWITLHLEGLVALGAALFTVAIGVLGAVLVSLAALVATVPDGDRLAWRVRRFVAGPLACTGVGLVSLGACAVVLHGGYGNAVASGLDDVGLAFPVLGIVAWVVVAVVVHRRHVRSVTRSTSAGT